MDAQNLQALAPLVADIALAATLTMIVVAALTAWYPTRVGSVTLPRLEGGRILVAVYAAALIVVYLGAQQAPAGGRELFASALAVAAFAVMEYEILDRFRGQRETKTPPVTSAH